MRKGRNVWAGSYQVTVAVAAALALARGQAPAREAAAPAAARKPTAAVLRIVFFHSLTCNECRKVKRVLERILKPWGGRVRVEWKSTGDIQVFRELLLYDEHCCYGVRTKSPPVMFVGRRHLEGEKRIYKDLARVVGEELAAGAVTYRPSAGPATKGGGDVPEEIVGRLRGFRIGALAAAGLLDGVNPCAFTTVVFLLSMLAHLGKTRRQLAVVGVGFTAAVFLTYFLLGLGLLGAIKTFSVIATFVCGGRQARATPGVGLAPLPWAVDWRALRPQEVGLEALELEGVPVFPKMMPSRRKWVDGIAVCW